MELLILRAELLFYYVAYLQARIQDFEMGGGFL